MKPILYEKTETQFTSNGIGRLSDAISCEVTEVRNGMFEVELEYPVGGQYFNDIKCGNIIFCTTDADKIPQAFDIYNVSKPNKGKIKAKARHISYRLSNIVTMPIGAIGTVAQDIFDLMMSESVGTNPFTFISDVTTIGAMSVKEPSTLRSIMGDEQENQVLYEWPGEYKWDMFTVYHLASRGQDNGVKIRTGKNVKRIEIEGDTTEIVTGVIPWWIGPSNATGDDIYVELPEHIVQSPDASLYPYQITKPLDMSDVWETQPSVSELRAGAQEWLSRNAYNTRNKITYAVDMSVITDETADLNVVKLCDTVTVQDPVLNVDVKLKIVKTVWNVLRDRYEKLEIGDIRRTLSYEMKRNNKKILQRLDNVETKSETIAKTASAEGTEAHVEQQLQDSNSALSQAIRRPATTTTVGAVKVGSGLSITSDGTLSATGGGGGSSSGVYWQETSDKGYRHYGTRKPVASADAWKRRKVFSLLETDRGAGESDWGYYDYATGEWVKVANNPKTNSLANVSIPELILGQNDYEQYIIMRLFGMLTLCTWITTSDGGNFPGIIFQRPPVTYTSSNPQAVTESAKDQIPANWRNNNIPHLCMYIDCRTDPTQPQGPIPAMLPEYWNPPSKIRLCIAYCDNEGFVDPSSNPVYEIEIDKKALSS